jgi:hypothetical protein
VIIHALQGVAEDCKCRISKPYSFLRLAVRCTVLHSRWCQSGVRRRWITRRRLFALDWRVAIETAYPQGVRFVLDYAIRRALASRSRTRPRSPRSFPPPAVPQSRVAPLHRSSAYLPPRRSARTSPRASGLSAETAGALTYVLVGVQRALSDVEKGAYSCPEVQPFTRNSYALRTWVVAYSHRHAERKAPYGSRRVRTS